MCNLYYISKILKEKRNFCNVSLIIHIFLKIFDSKKSEKKSYMYELYKQLSVVKHKLDLRVTMI